MAKFWKKPSARVVHHQTVIEFNGTHATRVQYGFDADHHVVLRHEQHTKRVNEEGAVNWAEINGFDCLWVG